MVRALGTAATASSVSVVSSLAFPSAALLGLMPNITGETDGAFSAETSDMIAHLAMGNSDTMITWELGVLCSFSMAH